MGNKKKKNSGIFFLQQKKISKIFSRINSPKTFKHVCIFKSVAIGKSVSLFTHSGTEKILKNSHHFSMQRKSHDNTSDVWDWYAR